jgi:hypothetical protein
MTALDLKPFCVATDGRPYLSKPFSLGEFSFATDGHFLVRVLRRDDVPENSAVPREILDRLPQIFSAVDHAQSWMPLDPSVLSSISRAAEAQECRHCDGRGSQHDCPNCTCTCEHCFGTGETQAKRSVTICGAAFNLRYVQKMLALPSVSIAMPVQECDPLVFSFAGGHGAIMVMRGTYSENFELVPKQAEAA